MYRAAFLACGVYIMLAGSGLLFVDEIALTPRLSQQAQPYLRVVGKEDERGRYHVQPPEWVPFTLMGLGMVTVLYAIALPKN
jgi:hypothetical protein